MMFTTVGDQKIGDTGVFNWHQSVRMPFTVLLFDGPHPDLRKDFFETESEARSRQVGVAVRVWRSKRRKTVTYFTLRRGPWSADARRVGPNDRLYLVGFARLS